MENYGVEFEEKPVVSTQTTEKASTITRLAMKLGFKTAKGAERFLLAISLIIILLSLTIFAYGYFQNSQSEVTVQERADAYNNK